MNPVAEQAFSSSEFRPTPADASPDTLSPEQKKELARVEREIAKKYMGIFPVFMIAWWIVNLTVWLSLWPLYFLGYLPLWLASLISFICIATCYLPSHEAQHANIGTRGSRWRWLNELVGHTATIPLAYGYLALRITHMQHHAHANDPHKDPDYGNNARNTLDFVRQYIRFLQPGRHDAYGETLAHHRNRKEATQAIVEQLALQAIFISTMVGLAWSGYAIEAALLWWLPKIVAGGYIRYFLSWAPHRPFEEIGRYRDTRAWRCLMGGQVGNVVSLGMEYHIVHHLYPSIPLNYTPKAYWEMRDLLVKRGCRIDNL